MTQEEFIASQKLISDKSLMKQNTGRTAITDSEAGTGQKMLVLEKQKLILVTMLSLRQSLTARDRTVD